jgi:HEAT repeat protein
MESATLLGQRGHAVIARGLRDPNLGVRAVAAVAAGKAGATRLAPQIESLLFDGSPYARSGAIFALAKMGQNVDQTPLARMLLNDPQPRVRAQAAFLLGELGNDSALPLLREAATSRPARATPGELALLDLQVAEALVKLGDEGAIHGVRAALYPARPEDLEATALAVQVLGEVRDRASVSQLVALSTYRDRTGQQMPAEVRMNVAIALAKMGKREGSFIADEFRDNPQPVLRAQAAAVYGFATADPTNLSKLERLLEDPEPMVRVAAAAGVIRATGEGSRRASAP